MIDRPGFKDREYRERFADKEEMIISQLLVLGVVGDIKLEVSYGYSGNSPYEEGYPYCLHLKDHYKDPALNKEHVKKALTVLGATIWPRASDTDIFIWFRLD